MFADITAKINSLPFGPGHALLSLYRGFASSASHPQRVWKGCLSSSQQAQIRTLITLLSPPGPTSSCNHGTTDPYPTHVLCSPSQARISTPSEALATPGE
jgi:hypothetical protein